ncbi:hypothetical protein DE146DRAFT_775200 [Phaeosphaeria sp. MPI-PUGE-AT-0046c]|nr:hypothetical protein DE146DRAFT_775200 [Phaeosphaeria sp. MPI-PUGE-AT-0046c]
MFSHPTRAHCLLTTMLLAGIILVPTALATPAVQDFADLRTVINAAAGTIGDPKSPNRGWGFSVGSGNGMGTADLINNITNTVLRVKFQVDTNQTAWLSPNNGTLNNTTPTPIIPPLPLSSSIALPSSLPTSLANATTDLSTPYIDYVSAIPNLCTALTSLGRAIHREMNAPVNTGIEGLQQSLTTLQTTMLQSDFISSQAILRTIRASGCLENARVAWGRFLNLPGRASIADSGDGESGAGGISGTPGPAKRRVARPETALGKAYTHKELWGRDRGVVGSDAWEVEKTRVVHGGLGAEHAREGRPFTV